MSQVERRVVPEELLLLLLLADEKLDRDRIHRRTAALPESNEILTPVLSRPVSSSMIRSPMALLFPSRRLLARILPPPRIDEVEDAVELLVIDGALIPIALELARMMTKYSNRWREERRLATYPSNKTHFVHIYLLTVSVSVCVREAENGENKRNLSQMSQSDSSDLFNPPVFQILSVYVLLEVP